MLLKTAIQIVKKKGNGNETGKQGETNKKSLKQNCMIRMKNDKDVEDLIEYVYCSITVTNYM